ncbi:MAG: peptidoglycan DD-metalloendopeptidase family protein [Tidjanibacter sp.]|nr:peptidoglycan DD-metalloendopeptidase family protein [Tidjanibacter sp.]
MFNGNIRYILRNLGKRHRISVTDEAGREVWYSFTTLVRAGLYTLGVAILVFIASLLVAAYTKVLDIVPGYDGITSRERMIENIIRLDSLERELGYMQIYAENVAQIMEGGSPVVRTLSPTENDKITSEKEVVAPSAMDSLLRRELEGTGRYGLVTKPEKQKITNAEILTPVVAEVVEKFSPASGRYGVRLSTADIQQVCAVQDGTVVLSTLEPEGYTVHIQHSANFLSTYRGLGQAHKSVGARVKGGEAIGATWNEDTASGGTAELEIQFWFDGTAVNPENYINF